MTFLGDFKNFSELFVDFVFSFQLKDISMTPYGARAIVLAQEKWSKAPQSYVAKEDLIPKSNDISNVASTSNSNPEVCFI